MAKFHARIPFSQMPCLVHKHRSEASDEEFESTWGKTKQQMHACHVFDPLDPDFNYQEDPTIALELPNHYESLRNMPRSEILKTNERSAIPACAAHEQEVAGVIQRSLISLHGIRPRLNPGESEMVDRLFFKMSRDRRDRVLKRRTENFKKNKKNNIDRGSQQSIPEITSPEEDVESYSDEAPRSFGNWNLKSLVSTLFPEPNDEENEPDISGYSLTKEFE